MSDGDRFFEVLFSTRAMRRLKPDPVQDRLVRQVLRAAVAAPTGGNRQGWRFLVLKDPEIKKRAQAYYKGRSKKWSPQPTSGASRPQASSEIGMTASWAWWGTSPSTSTRRLSGSSPAMRAPTPRGAGPARTSIPPCGIRSYRPGFGTGCHADHPPPDP